MINFTFNHTSYSITPSETGMYDVTHLFKTLELPLKNEVYKFARKNNGAWKDQYVSQRGGNTRGSTQATETFTIAYLEWVGAEVNGKRVIKAERAEVEFGNSVVDKMFANYSIIRQYQVLNFRVDFYIPELNIAVEYDEPQHNTPEHKAADDLREAEIKRELGCTFIRVPH